MSGSDPHVATDQGLPLELAFDPEYLGNLALKHCQAYAQAEPFPHIVLDNFLPGVWLDHVLTDFPQPGEIEWRIYEAATEKKLASRSEQQMGPITRLLLYQLNSGPFIEFLETLTGIDGLIPDPHFVGGGLHQIEPGGYLKMHVDFNHHDQLRLDRRLNLLIYLNQDWPEAYGGHLQLWDQTMTQCVQKILPIFNRCVIFSTTDFSYHGHPEPLTCPPGQTRKSLALYYYSNGRPATEVSSENHCTQFEARPGEDLEDTRIKPSLSHYAKTVLKQITPPILVNLLKSRS